MEDFINVHQTFEKVIFTDQRVNNREFDGCIFKNCDFSNSDFSGNTFLDCEFYDCNLSNLYLRGTSLKQVHFENCKLLGIQFNECDDFLFAVDFNSCNVDYASFINKKMLKAKFINSSVREVNFTSTDLTKATFDDSNLQGAIFQNTILKEANFYSAQNYTIDPEANMLKKAKFSKEGLPGLLDKYDIKIV